MIDCLSQPDWLKPQIDFLLYLQHYRDCYFEVFNKFFLSITCFGEMWIPALISCIVYWCIDLRAGVYLFSLAGINTILTHILKMAFCVYRPWVLSDKIHPVNEAIAYAKGYSFPSGHSFKATATFGGLAMLLRKKTILSILCILLVLTVGFSRMWLGVHTPQDVIVGISVGFFVVILMHFVINWAEKNLNRYLYLLGIINLIGILSLVHICYFSTFPIDYVNGELLVNPYRMMYTAVLCYGYALGQINGVMLCRRFFPFDPQKGTLATKIIRGAVGGIIVVLLLKYIVQKLFLGMYDYKIAFGVTFIVAFFFTFIYPVVFTKLEACFNNKK